MYRIGSSLSNPDKGPESEYECLHGDEDVLGQVNLVSTRKCVNVAFSTLVAELLDFTPLGEPPFQVSCAPSLQISVSVY